jgi:hypothetical protein
VASEEKKLILYPKPYKPNSVEFWLLLLGGVWGPLMYRQSGPEQIGLNVVLLLAAGLIALFRYKKWKISPNREALGVEPYVMLAANIVFIVMALGLLVKSLIAENVI